MTKLSGADCWERLVRRENGPFFYSVKSTGIYCRANCPSRLPAARNVVLYCTFQEAEAAGFRPCKRCQPNGPRLEEIYAAKITAACHELKTAETPPNLAMLSNRAGMSRFHFQRVFTRVTGLSPKARIRSALPVNSTVTDAIYHAGFNSNGRFYETSNKLLGMKPLRFKNGGENETIRFATAACSLGLALVAATERGVCAILLGDEAEYLIADLKRRFPCAQIIPGEVVFAELVSHVVTHIDNPCSTWKLPLDIRGTAFQQKVWRALQEISPGKTASYTDVAKTIGAPKAVRAVAGACAANSLAVVIPCHRVIGANGAISGYRWGVERKQTLLKKEQP
jgi:AraC family transcriptional regulator of adaptative response/methylated-DNA-[protein]-cysteine methyltransferase